MFRIFCLLIGFALGHIQTSYIIGKIFKKIDIREHGTGNPGTANSLRVMGVKFALPILIVDILKSFGAFVICSALFGGRSAFFTYGDGVMGAIPGMYGSFGAVAGHLYPVYMRFKGGKGIACGIGMILALNLQMTALILAIAATPVLITRYFTSAAFSSLIFLPFALALFKFEPEVVLIGVCLSSLLLYRHKNNFIRIISGKENKIWHKTNNSNNN